MTVLAVAHRTPGDAAAVAALTGCGADVFEIDLRLLGDDVVVTHFQPLLPAFRGLRGLPVLHDGWRLRLGRDPLAPLLDGVTTLLPPGARVLLDLKDDRGAAAHRLADRLLAGAADPARHEVSSHSWPVLARLEAAGFRTWRTIGSRRALRTFDRDGPGGAWAVTVRHTLLDPAVLARLTARTRVVAWTVNDPLRARQLLAGGVAGLTTDSCEVLALAAERR